MADDDSMLKVQHLNKSYGHQQTLFDVTFSCQTGHIIGLIGANGAGKTTIMRTILGLTHYDGQISIGQEQLIFNQNAHPNEVGALIEAPGLYPYLTGRDHLKLFSNKTDSVKIEQLITDFDLAKFVDLKTHKYSLGMKQKLGIALAFLNQPRLIILDEPFNGLDTQATQALRAIISKASSTGTTFLISSHILSELQRLVDDLVVIKAGHVIQQTTMTELLNQGQHRLCLQTSDDQKAQAILTADHYTVTHDNGVVIELTTTQTVEQIVRLMAKHQLTIQDMSHIDDNLETAILKMLEEPEANNA